MVLKGLPQNYKSFTKVVTQRERPMSFLEFKVSLRNYEDTENLHYDASTSKTPPSAVMFVKDKKQDKFKQNRWCDICKSSTHDTKYCRKLKDVQGKP